MGSRDHSVENRDYSAFLSEVRAGTDLLSVISEHVALKRAGRRHKGLCPFHDEKTPSFTVDGERGLFYCFGCSTGGDAFKFLMLREGLEFPEAARLLGERLGLRPPERKGPGADRRRRIFDANERALGFFRATLANATGGRKAREYLERRGLKAETIEEFRIGFAPAAWDRLRDSMAAAGMQRQIGIEAGLLVDRDGDGRRVYDRFRNRIIFPITSLGGEVVAFGGRTLDADEPAKYLNSPESPVYVKGEVLYGLDRARGAVRDAGFAVLVEGYMDLVGLAAAGFTNVVATLGTALTASQARLLRRTTDRVVVNYDPDPAGEQASLRALEILLGMDFRVTVLRLPEGLDPDDFVRKQGAGAYRAALEGSTPAIEFLADSFAAGLDLEDPRDRARGVNQLLPYLARRESPIERAGYLSLIARRFRVEEDLVVAELREALKRGLRGIGDAKASSARPRVVQPLKPAEGRLLGILVGNPGARAKVLGSVEIDDFEGSRIEPILRTLLEGAGDEDEPLEPAAMTALLPDDESRALVTRAVLEHEEGSAEEAESCLLAIRKSRLTQERDRVQRELERAHEPAATNELMSQKIELSRQIDALS